MAYARRFGPPYLFSRPPGCCQLPIQGPGKTIAKNLPAWDSSEQLVVGDIISMW